MEAQWPGASIEWMLHQIDGQNGKICLRIYRENRRLFKKVQGSTHNHQAWKGGYHDHIEEAMNFGLLMYALLYQIGRSPAFSLSDLLLAIFLHDIEKPWKYELYRGQLRHRKSLNTKAAQRRFRDKKLKEYGIVLSAEQENAMRYAEGELDEYTNRRRKMNELAGLVHVCDVLSARVCHNYPRKRLPKLGVAIRASEQV